MKLFLSSALWCLAALAFVSLIATPLIPMPYALIVFAVGFPVGMVLGIAAEALDRSAHYDQLKSRTFDR